MPTMLHRTFWPLAALLSCGVVNAQGTAATAWLEEINNQIWRPFLEGVAKNDASLYVQVHSTGYVRVQEQGRLILDHDSCVDDTKKMMQRYEERGTALSMQVRFEERISNGRQASERGISKVVFASKDGAPRIFYGRFHTISRKENGAWKILSDFYPASDQAVTEDDFQRARAIDDLTPFGCYMPYPAKQVECGRSSP